MSGSRSRGQAAMQRMGLPADFKLFSAFPFAGLNQSASRIGMEDPEFYWLENYIRIDNGQLRTLWDSGPAFYTAPSGKTIVSFFWYAIGSNVYVAVFFTDGTAVQVPFPHGQAFATAITNVKGTFYMPGGPLPACSQSGSQYLLIANNNTNNDYWIWDGSILYGAGGIAPFTADELTSGGSGYTGPPTVLVYGGTGSGIVLQPVLAEGSVVALTVLNPGTAFTPGDIAQVQFTGGGSDTGPALVADLMPAPIASVTLLSAGYNYAAGIYPIVFDGGGFGTGLAGTYTVQVPGPISYLTITNSGSGYTRAPGVYFPHGGGSGAAATVALQPQGVASIDIVSGGTNLFTAPTLTIVGGGGSGATATCTISGGSIDSVTVTSPGSGYTKQPAVEAEAGLNNAASAVLTMMPFGVSGADIETYQGRVWLPFPNRPSTQWNGGTFFVSAPGSLTDFATSDGGLIFTNTDRFLRQQYTFMRQTSNFLYAVGDSSVSVISNPQSIANQTAGTVSTTISYQNTDPQTGAPWRDSAQDFGTTILFANPFGIFAVYGGAVRKVSKKVDLIFNSAVFPPKPNALTPSSAVANIYSQKVYLLLLTITDPFTFKPRNVMLGHKNESEWTVVSQTTKLNYIGTKTVNSDLEAWGTDGTALYPLLNQPSANLAKVISTKAWGGADSVFIKTSHSLYLNAEDLSANQAGLTFTGTVDGLGLAVPAVNSVTSTLLSCPSISQPIANPLTFVAPRGLGAMFACGIGAGVPQVPAIGLGLTLATSSPDLALRNVQLGYIETMAVA